MVSALCLETLIGYFFLIIFGIMDFQGQCRSDHLLYVLYLSWHDLLEGRDFAPGAKGADMLGNSLHCLSFELKDPRQMFHRPSDLVPSSHAFARTRNLEAPLATQVTSQRERRAKAARARAASSGHAGPQDMHLVDLDIS